MAQLTSLPSPVINSIFIFRERLLCDFLKPVPLEDLLPCPLVLSRFGKTIGSTCSPRLSLMQYSPILLCSAVGGRGVSWPAQDGVGGMPLSSAIRATWIDASSQLMFFLSLTTLAFCLMFLLIISKWWLRLDIALAILSSAFLCMICNWWAINYNIITMKIPISYLHPTLLCIQLLGPYCLSPLQLRGNMGFDHG